MRISKSDLATHPVSGLPMFIPYEEPAIAYAGMCFDEPEEGDVVEIKGFDFMFLGQAVEDDHMERFGWVHL